MDELNLLIEKTLNPKEDSDKHTLPIFSLVLASNAKIIIELGSRGGNTLLPFVMGASKTNGLVYTVDIDNCIEQLKEYIPQKYEAYYKFIHQDAIKFLEGWDKSKKADLILIDDWHSYDQVKKELELLKDMITEKSLIFLHDTMYQKTEPFYHISNDISGEWANGAPAKAVLELPLISWEYVTLPWNNGLTILRKKTIPNYIQR